MQHPVLRLLWQERLPGKTPIEALSLFTLPPNILDGFRTEYNIQQMVGEISRASLYVKGKFSLRLNSIPNNFGQDGRSTR